MPIRFDQHVTSTLENVRTAIFRAAAAVHAPLPRVRLNGSRAQGAVNEGVSDIDFDIVFPREDDVPESWMLSARVAQEFYDQIGGVDSPHERPASRFVRLAPDPAIGRPETEISFGVEYPRERAHELGRTILNPPKFNGFKLGEGSGRVAWDLDDLYQAYVANQTSRGGFKRCVHLAKAQAKKTGLLPYFGGYTYPLTALCSQLAPEQLRHHAHQLDVPALFGDLAVAAQRTSATRLNRVYPLFSAYESWDRNQVVEALTDVADGLHQVQSLQLEPFDDRLTPTRHLALSSLA